MKTIEDKTLDLLLSPGDTQNVMPEHRAWMNAQIKQTLAKKANGEMRYTSLDQARQEFDLDAS